MLVEKFALLVVMILVAIIILTSGIAKTKYYEEAICQRQTPTAIYLNAYGDAEAKLIFITFGRTQDIVRIMLSSNPIIKELSSATYLMLFKTENGWKNAELLTQNERRDFKNQTAISKEEQAFIQKCFLPKTLI